MLLFSYSSTRINNGNTAPASEGERRSNECNNIRKYTRRPSLISSTSKSNTRDNPINNSTATTTTSRMGVYCHASYADASVPATVTRAGYHSHALDCSTTTTSTFFRSSVAGSAGVSSRPQRPGTLWRTGVALGLLLALIVNGSDGYKCFSIGMEGAGK